MRPELTTGLNFCRVVACFMVVTLHLSTPDTAPLDNNWIIFDLYNSFVRPCVPLFLMLSGALLLHKKEAASIFYKKRFTRIIPPLLFWSVFYAAWKTSKGVGYSGVTEALLAIFSGPVYYHLWYLYAIVGIYLFMPFLAKIYQNSHAKEKQMFIGIWLLCASILPTAASFIPSLAGLNTAYELTAFAGLGGYVFLGAYVFERLQQCERTPWRSSLALFISCSLMTAVLTYVVSKQQNAFNPVFHSYLSPLVTLASVSAFCLLISAGKSLMRFDNALSALSACTLGIYGLHAFIMNTSSLIWGPLTVGHSMLWIVPLLSALIFAATFVIIYILRLAKPLRLVI